MSEKDYKGKIDAGALEARLYGRHKISKAEIACFLSHQQMMKNIADNGSDVAAILEDDAKLLPDFPSVLSGLERIKREFDVVSLCRNDSYGVKGKLFNAAFPSPLCSDITLGRVKFNAKGTQGYVITRPAARRFIKSMPKMTGPVDIMLTHYWENGLDLYYLNRPVVAHNHDLCSQIVPEIKEIMKQPICRSSKARARRFFFRRRRSFAKRYVYWRRRLQDKRRFIWAKTM